MSAFGLSVCPQKPALGAERTRNLRRTYECGEMAFLLPHASSKHPPASFSFLGLPVSSTLRPVSTLHGPLHHTACHHTAYNQRGKHTSSGTTSTTTSCATFQRPTTLRFATDMAMTARSGPTSPSSGLPPYTRTASPSCYTWHSATCRRRKRPQSATPSPGSCPTFAETGARSPSPSFRSEISARAVAAWHTEVFFQHRVLAKPRTQARAGACCLE